VARLEVLPAEDRSLPYWAVPTLDEESTHCSVLMVLVPNADTGSPLQGAPFFLFNHNSHATHLDHGEIMHSPFPARCPRSGGTLQAPLCHPPRPVPEDVTRTKETTKERAKEGD